MIHNELITSNDGNIFERAVNDLVCPKCGVVKGVGCVSSFMIHRERWDLALLRFHERGSLTVDAVAKGNEHRQIN